MSQEDLIRALRNGLRDERARAFKEIAAHKVKPRGMDDYGRDYWYSKGYEEGISHALVEMRELGLWPTKR